MDIKKVFNTYYVGALKRYFDFKGRASRKAYWMFVLINIIVGWAVIFIDNIFGTHDAGFWGFANGTFSNFYSLVLLLPGLAIATRRLHDVGKSGKTLFYLFLPVIGWIIILLELIKEGDLEENEFGPVPQDDADPQPEGHHYAPNDDPDDSGGIDVQAIRKEAEKIVEEKKVEESKKPEEPKKEKKANKPKLRDKGAVDFTYHQKEKRKT